MSLSSVVRTERRSTLPFFKEGLSKFDEFEFEFAGATQSSKEKKKVSQVIQVALLFLNAPTYGEEKVRLALIAAVLHNWFIN